MNFKKSILSLTAAAFSFATVSAQAQSISLLRDAEIENFLHDYANPIFKAAGIRPDSIEILLVNDDGFNAFAGGRYMGMNTGTLLVADTPNQIEAVIAHEAGHLAGGHSQRTDDAIASASRSMLLGLLLAGAAIAAGAPDVGMAALGLGQTIGVANFLKYSRGQEATADQSSVTYLNAIGHSSKGAIEIWRKLRNSQIIRGSKINPYQQTHPLANDRLSALQTRAEASPYYDVEDSPEAVMRLRYIQAKIYGFLHDPNFTLRKYPLSDQSGPAHYGRALAYYRSSQIEKALDELSTLIEDNPENPYFHELEGQMQFEFGHIEESIAPHRKSVELLPGNALLRINLGRALMASQNPANHEEAITILRSALRIEKDNAFGWYELARAYDSVGNEPMALLATAESKYNGGDRPAATQFAQRALMRLEKGSPEWRQAMDIILASAPEGKEPALPGPPPEDDGAPLPAPDTRDTGRPDVPDPVPQGSGSN